MPQLGETVTEGTITKWFKAVGDTVARDEPLFEVSTDKVDTEVPSPAEGVLTAILVQEGDTVDVGVALAVIDGAAPVAATPGAPEPQARDPDPDDGGADPSRSGGPVAGAARRAGGCRPAAPARPRTRTRGDPRRSHVPRRPRRCPPVQRTSPRSCRRWSADCSPTTGSTPPRSRARGSEDESPGPTWSRSSSGEQLPRRSRVSLPPRPPSLRARRTPAPVAGQATGRRDEIVPFTNIRRRTAEHMVRSKAISAHTLMVREIDYERVEQVRRLHGGRFREEEGFTLTYLPFVARAAVEALAEFPHLNASVGDDALVVHRDINLGIAVDLDNEGLIVPVVHRAEELNLRGMARRIRDVADRARTKRLSLDDISGGTFSITNSGPFGTLITGAIINQPQVAILSTDGVSRKPVVVELPDGTETIGIHSVGLVAMNFDHRAVDGAYVARFLARLSAILDDRDWAGEL